MLPADLRQRALRCISDYVAPFGTLLLVCRGRNLTDVPGDMPWPLTREELQAVSTFGFSEISFEDYRDTETPPVRRFRVEYVRGD